MSSKRRLLELRQEQLRRARRRALDRYRPYPKQFEFHAAGATFDERMFSAGNQDGKSFSGSHELAMHATGLYPDWWAGRRFDHPVLAWTGSETNESSKEIVQKALLGETSDLKSPDFGTGALPGDLIVKCTTRQAGVKEVVDEVLIKHFTNGVEDGVTRIALKTYEQGRTKWQGKPVDVLWLDEEPPADIYSECQARTQRTNGIIFVTFTPLLGFSQVVLAFFKPEPEGSPKSLVQMSHYDCVGGTWPEGTPWAGQEWKGHYTEERIAEIIAKYPEHERETRAFGVPTLGEGKVFALKETDYTCDPFEIPLHWPRIKGCDFGFDHPGAGCELAYDRDNDTVYVVWSYRRSGEAAVYHAAMLKGQRPWVPVSWPHDGLNTEKASGETLADAYRKHGANMLHISARYDDEKGGRQDVEPSVQDIHERMRLGGFKIFRTQSDLLEEMRTYHRENNKIVPIRDDIISAMRYAYMMLRYARTEGGQVRKHRYDRPILSSRAA